MSILTRFFGKREAVFERGLVANPAIHKPLSLQVLFKSNFEINISEIGEKFNSYHPKLSKAKIEFDGELGSNGALVGLVGWGDHVIQIVGFDRPFPSDYLESCIAASHYGADLKDQARAHQSHLILYYKGYDGNPINQYASLALLGGFLSEFGAIVVTNESGHTSFPALALSGRKVEGDIFELLESLPLLILYCGFVKFEVEDVDGVWLRTYGAPLLGLPDMASLVKDHSFSQDIFDIFSNVFSYLLESGAKFEAGNTMQVGEDVFMRLRLNTDKEYYLDSEAELFVAEFISESERNQC